MRSMASLSNLLFCCYALFLLPLNSLLCSQVSGVEVARTHHVVSVASLVTKDICPPFKESDSTRMQIAVYSRLCYGIKNASKPTHEQILHDDLLRVDWLHYRAKTFNSKNKAQLSNTILASTDIPTRQGVQLGSSNYVINVGFGTPKVMQSVIFDTGSDVTWIQCQPCASSCYKQDDPLFDPTKSRSYMNISCSSSYCSYIDNSDCLGSTCLYQVQYGDNSKTVGFFAKDTLTLTATDVITNFRFGCGEQNSGIFGRIAGLIGLGRNQVSLVSQSYGMYGGVFSYCLPSTSSQTGFLSFGNSNFSNVRYTPMLTYSDLPSFYFVELISISVAGKKLAIDPTIFSNAGTFLDSGTVITRLPPTAYTVLSSAFKNGMSQYPRVAAAGILDTCYNFSSYTTVSIPSVALNFRGVSINLDFFGIIYVISNTQACLAFAPNGDDTDLVIIGNTQQKTYKLVHDLTRGLIGFGPGGC